MKAKKDAYGHRMDEIVHDMDQIVAGDGGGNANGASTYVPDVEHVE